MQELGIHRVIVDQSPLLQLPALRWCRLALFEGQDQSVLAATQEHVEKTHQNCVSYPSEGGWPWLDRLGNEDELEPPFDLCGPEFYNDLEPCNINDLCFRTTHARVDMSIAFEKDSETWHSNLYGGYQQNEMCMPLMATNDAFDDGYRGEGLHWAGLVNTCECSFFLVTNGGSFLEVYSFFKAQGLKYDPEGSYCETNNIPESDILTKSDSQLKCELAMVQLDD